MAIKDQVQGVILALYGAAGGSHLADLTKQATDGSIGGLAGGLVGLQGLLTGKDLSKNAEWIKDMLANVGLKEGTAAHTEATTWATAQLTAGASRADVVVAAVDYLLAPTGQGEAFTKLATAFQGDVAASIKWSEGAEGSKVISYADLKKATVAVRDTIVEVFGDFVASTKGLSDALIEAGKVLGVSKVADAGAGVVVTKSIPADTNGDKSVSADELKTFSEALTPTALTTEATTSKNALTVAIGRLEEARAKTTEDAKGNKVLLTDAALDAAVTAAAAAIAADATAKAALAAIATKKVAVAEDVAKNGTDGALLATLRTQLTTMLGLTDDEVNSVTGVIATDDIGGKDVGQVMNYLNAASSATSTVDPDNYTDPTSKTNTNGKLVSAKTWLADVANAGKTLADYQTEVLNALATLLGDVTEGDFNKSAAQKTVVLIEERAKLNKAVSDAQTAFDTDKGLGQKYDEALDAVAARKILVDNVAALQAYSDATAAQKKLVDAATTANADVLERFKGLGYAAPDAIENGETINASQTKGVYFNKLKANQSATFTEGFTSNDTLYLGDYAVKTLTKAEAEGWGSTTRVGDAATLEIFLAASGTTDTKIYIETNAVAGNALNKAEIATITLTGITPDKVSLVDGFVVIGGGI